MGMKINTELPLPANLKAEYPLPKELAEIKKKRDAEIREIFEGKSDKFVVIVGPCSADNEDSVCDYVNRLAKVNEKVSDRLMIIPRIYTNKPRTTGEGYKGMLHQPDPSEESNLLKGIVAIRKLHMRVPPCGFFLIIHGNTPACIPSRGIYPKFYVLQRHRRQNRRTEQELRN